MQRRSFLKVLFSAGGGTVLCGCGWRDEFGAAESKRKVIVLAFDGMDPTVLQSLMDAGRTPNFSEVARRGSHTTVATSTPPITPVAFSNIISGCDPGTHGIFDFIHRDPNPPQKGLGVNAFFSLSSAVPPKHEWAIPLGGWRLPLTGGSTELMRRGPSFWDYLIPAGENVDVYHLPATYPPPETPDGDGRFRCLSGMGTPDLLGTYGEFTVFGTDVPPKGRKVGGGHFIHLNLTNHSGTGQFVGPPNFLKKLDDKGRVPDMAVEMRFTRDPEAAVVKVEFGDQCILLNDREWSQWVPVVFDTKMPGGTVLSAAQAPTTVGCMVRFHVKQVHPHLTVYVSPQNLDPRSPAQPISTPGEFASELAGTNGPFYTTGIPEDTKALSRGALSEEGFLEQSDLVLKEKIEEYRHSLAHFESGCLFSYFGTTDLVQHMFWRDRDPDHPGRIAEQGDRYAHVIDDLYVRMDGLVGEALEQIGDDDVLMVLSDHGFTTFRREFSVNTWLLENGYLSLRDPSRQGKAKMFLNVNWTGTQAYAMGLNAVYLNMRGREKYGSVSRGERPMLLGRIRQGLLDLRDEDGSSVVDRVDVVEELYPDADPTIAPDLLIGYARGYRASWATVLGGVPKYVLRDNRDRWSGTHCVSPDLMPGILLSTKEFARASASLQDIAPTILGAFGIETPDEMQGRNLYAGA